MDKVYDLTSYDDPIPPTTLNKGYGGGDDWVLFLTVLLAFMIGYQIGKWWVSRHAD